MEINLPRRCCYLAESKFCDAIEMLAGGVEERGKWVMGIEEGTCWDEQWVLYGNQFDNKLYS